MIPPRLVRRLVLAPLVIALGLGLLVLSPLLGLLTICCQLLGLVRPGKLRILRLAWLALVWFGGETAALITCLGLWIASGFGGRLRTEPYQDRHYALMRWFLDLVYRTAGRACGLTVVIDEPELDPEEQSARLARPVIVLSRHAGPGDSLLLVRHLLSVYERRPRVVMKAALQLDPGLDVVANRLPNVFVSRRRREAHTDQIARLASGLDNTGALVIFPEGGNWTAHRWRRAIRRLHRQGLPDLATRAESMPNLLAPRPGGTLAAIHACPTADVIFVAHAGLDKLVSVGDVWRHLPLGVSVRAKWWRVPAWEVPRQADRETQVNWLYDWWERMDAWISDDAHMNLTLLTVPDCPSAEVFKRRLATAIAGRPEISVAYQVVSTEDDAARTGMTGSPTLLVDGIDPFAIPGAAPALSCRLYPDGEGHLDRAPSVSALTRALGSHARGLTSAAAWQICVLFAHTVPGAYFAG
jgi:1-acyl-sn-glycerol-3-phosphate acyltransferase